MNSSSKNESVVQEVDRCVKCGQESALIPELKAYLRHVLQCSGTPDDCDTCSEANTLAFLEPAELLPDKLNELRQLFIRPAHECSEQFQEARAMAGSVDALVWCPQCREHSVINNVCLTCGKDNRARYGDFEHEMSPKEWEQVRVNLPLPAPITRTGAQSSEARRMYWRQKQTESRRRSVNATE